jgi:hypothetical protein
VPFSRNYTRRFVYDSETCEYAVFNNDGPHIDAALGDAPEAQLHVANVLVQFVSMHVIPNDAPGRRDVATTGSGDGLLFTEGAYVPVCWSRESHATPTSWHFADGQPLMLNPGATWICVLQKNTNLPMDKPMDRAN